MEIPPKKFNIYTDGSAKATGLRAGSFCSVVVSDTGIRKLRCGTSVPSSIGKMEIMGVCAGLETVLEIMDGNKWGYSVHIYCDSEYVVNCATGRYKRTKNQNEWAIFDRFASGLNISIEHTNRNTLPDQAICDDV